MKTTHHSAVAAVALLVACQSGKDPDTGGTPPREHTVTLSAPDRPDLAVSWSDEAPDTCRVESGEHGFRVEPSGDGTRLYRGERALVATRPHPTGRQLLLEGEPAARVPADQPDGQLSLIDPQGVALFRIRVDGSTAIVRDRAGVPRLTVAPDGDTLVAAEPDGRELGRIEGTDDPILAALLATDAADSRLRALLACERLLR